MGLTWVICGHYGLYMGINWALRVSQGSFKRRKVGGNLDENTEGLNSKLDSIGVKYLQIPTFFS